MDDWEQRPAVTAASRPIRADTAATALELAREIGMQGALQDALSLKLELGEET
jgi:hypothetical protein